MIPFSNLNDGSSGPPRLRTGNSLWGLEKLPMNGPREWTLEEKVKRVKNAGFEHLECWLPSLELQRDVPPLLKEYDLDLILVERLFGLHEIHDLIAYGASAGAQCLVCQPATAFHTLEDVAHLVRAGARIAAQNGMGFFVETHRGTFTESIRQTLELIDAVPDIAFAVDLSHFVVGGEVVGGEIEGSHWESFLQRVRPIIDRVGHIHGRVSNGQQIQVHIRDGDGLTSLFRQLWNELFRVWHRKAVAGDVLSFSTELGPPPYASTLPDGREFSDRWQQSLVMKRLVEEAWLELEEKHACCEVAAPCGSLTSSMVSSSISPSCT